MISTAQRRFPFRRSIARRYVIGMSDLDFRRTFFTHLACHLRDEGYGALWPRELSMATGVIQSMAAVLSRKEFENLLRAVAGAVERMDRGPHPLLPSTLVCHLYDGQRAQFGGIPQPSVALAGHLMSALHQALPEEMFEDLLAGLADAALTVTTDERRERYLRTAG